MAIQGEQQRMFSQRNVQLQYREHYQQRFSVQTYLGKVQISIHDKVEHNTLS